MKSILLSFLSIGIFGILLLSSCENTVEEYDIDYGYSYFPIDSGYWAIYQVDSLKFSVFLPDGQADVSVQVKEEYGPSFLDNEGRPSVAIYRRVRSDVSIPWENINPTVWYSVKDEERAERMEGELRFMNMVFPVTEGKTWMGNSYLNTTEPSLEDYDGWEYIYSNVGQAKMIGETSYAETVTITQNDYEDLVDKSFSQEIYAKDIGLVMKEQWILNLGQNDITSQVTWPDRAERGFVMTKKLLEFGFN